MTVTSTIPTDTGREPVDSFWTDLARTRAELARFPIPAPTTTIGVVGPLSAAVPVVRRLQREAGPGPCEVIVLSPRAELVCEPGWVLVRSGSRLAEAAHRPVATLVVIDVTTPLPRWVGPLVERLRRAGMGLVHHVVDGEPDDDELLAARHVLGAPLALDLAAPVDPGRLVELLDDDVPLASVRGVPLTAEVVLAARLSSGRR